MYHYPADIYTEPEPDTDTLANLGPLTGMAGIWTSADGMDVNPKPDGPEHQPFIERYELQPIDAQTNGPQLFYGLRYHTRIVKPDDPETFHDQVGYWLWEPATRAILLTLSIPRGQTAMAVGQATPDAKAFTLAAVRGSLTNGIVSNPFLEQAFRTDRYTIKVEIHTDGTWSYEQDTLLIVPGQARVAVGLEFLATGLVIGAVQVYLDLTAERGDEDTLWRRVVGRVFPAVVSCGCLVIGGATLLGQAGGGLYWLVPSVLSALIFGLVNVWVLLVEILR